MNDFVPEFVKSFVIFALLGIAATFFGVHSATGTYPSLTVAIAKTNFLGVIIASLVSSLFFTSRKQRISEAAAQSKLESEMTEDQKAKEQAKEVRMPSGEIVKRKD